MTTLPGLGRLEFYRHTEADRTLISEEMRENHDYVVPHLLGQPILTKPPLYYIATASIFNLTGAYDEFSSRLVSVFAACMLALVYFTACSYEGLKNPFAYVLLLITSVSFMTLESVAEIDMLYSAFCAAALYLLYFSFKKNSFLLLIASYFCAAIAFLIKGPPIIAFYAISSLIYYFVNKPLSFKKYIAWNVLGVLCFLIAISLWIVPLLERIDFAIIKEQFHQEILGRAVGEPRKHRGFFFYYGSALGAALPWSLPLLVYLLFGKPKLKEKFENKDNIIFFSMVVAFSGIFLLSLAKGKSSRYIFPLHVFVMQVMTYLLSYSVEFWKKQSLKLNLILYAICFFSFVAALVASIKINSTAIFYCLPMLSCLCLVANQKRYYKKFLFFVFGVLLLKLPHSFVFNPYRNMQKSVKPIVNEIIKESNSAPIYSAGMYERWIQYYLKRSGINVLQLQGLKSYTLNQEQVYWLITDKDESDLLDLVRKDSSSRLIKTFTLPSTKVYFYLSNAKQVLELVDYINKNRKDDGIY